MQLEVVRSSLSIVASETAALPHRQTSGLKKKKNEKRTMQRRAKQAGRHKEEIRVV